MVTFATFLLAKRLNILANRRLLHSVLVIPDRV